jgi:hypothetical protein
MDETMAAMPVDSWGELCLFLKGSPDSFTGMLLALLAKSDPGNLARLRRLFPRHVAAWEIWVVRAPQLTYGELEEALAGRGHDAREAAVEELVDELRATLPESAQDEITARRWRRDLDAEWEPLACSSREALRLLGYAITPRCLPGEPDACGGTFAQHAASHLAALGAVIEHHVGHLGSSFDSLIERIYNDTAEEVSHW